MRERNFPTIICVSSLGCKDAVNEISPAFSSLGPGDETVESV